MKTKQAEEQIVAELDALTLQIAGITLYLEGSLQNSSKRYEKKDGTVSVYKLPQVLQYPTEGGQSQMRIPKRHLPLVQELLEEGKRRRALLSRHRTLSMKLFKLQIKNGSAEKKTS